MTPLVEPSELAKLFIQLQDTIYRSPRLVVWSWDTIKRLGDSPALRTSYVFLFAVPVLARALTHVPETIEFSLLGKQFAIAVALPFSWFVLFFAACAASLGNVFHSIRCPPLIKEFADYPAFQLSKRDGSHLLDTMRLTVNEDGSVTDLITTAGLKYNDNPVDVAMLAESLLGNKELTPTEFYFVRDSANLSRPFSRLAASASFFAAFGGLVVIAIQNIVFVIQFLTRAHPGSPNI